MYTSLQATALSRSHRSVVPELPIPAGRGIPGAPGQVWILSWELWVCNENSALASIFPAPHGGGVPGKPGLPSYFASSSLRSFFRCFPLSVMLLKFSWKIPHLCSRARLGAEGRWFSQAVWRRMLELEPASAPFQPGSPRGQWEKIISTSLGRGPGHAVNCTLMAGLPVQP